MGYTNNIASVLNIYWHQYFPLAILTAKAVNTPGEPPVFRYTSHAWLIDLFFDCPTHLGTNCSAASNASAPGSGTGGSTRGGGAARPGLEVSPDYEPGCVVCPNATLRAAVEQAIKDDVITWHAFPFNAEPELADAQLLRDGIKSVHALDRRFGKPLKTVVSQRDVPGVTRGIVPLLRAEGVLAFSEGANSQIVPPATPGNVFNWTDMASGESAIMLIHPRGYGMMEAAAAAAAAAAGGGTPTLGKGVSVPS